MKLVLRAIVFGLSLLLSFGLIAQEEVNVATIAEINITLNDNCEALVILEEVLTGDFDVDGNDLLPDESAFTIVVEDGNEANGPIIDGCGQFTVRVTADPALVTGFTTGWSLVNAEDKTAPFFTVVPVAPVGPLYCDQVDGSDLGTLANTISRCYTYNTVTESIVVGTLNAALRTRLLSDGGIAIASDACSELVEICVNDVVTRAADQPQCNDVVITRTFTASDGSCPSNSGEANEVAVVSYDIVFTRPGLDDLNTENIQDVVTIQCDELDDLGLAFGDLPAPRPEDLPTFDGPNGTTISLTLGAGGSFCGIGLTYEDGAAIFTCDLAYKVVRTYTIIDWCNPDDVRTLTQVVKVGDFTAPTLTVPFGVQEFGTNAGNLCGAYIRLDLPGITITDGCSEAFTIRANIYPNGNLNGTPIGAYPVNLSNTAAEISGLLPVGNHIVRYTYSDECNNVGTTDVDIRIVDESTPVAICENGLNVSLSSSVSADPDAPAGLVVLTPSMIDNNSYDDCTDNLRLDIARVRQLANGIYELLPGAIYGPTVVLTCEDLGNVLVGLRVADDNGLSNFCWMTVLLEDKTAPTCVAPANSSISCVDFEDAGLPNDITTVSDAQLDLVFGAAFGRDNCSVTLEQSITGSVNSCGVGTFRRVFRTTDGSGLTNSNQCLQVIEVIGLHDYVIRLPGDATAFCMQEPNINGLQIEEGRCDLITTEVSRDTFTSDADECFKIRLEYNIINWCEYNTLGEPYLIPRDYDGDNNLREATFLYLEPNNPGFTTDDVAYLDNDAIFGNNNFASLLNSDGVPYGVNNSRGAFRYYQYVKIHDEVAPQVVENNQLSCFPATSINCTGSVALAFEVSDNCTIFSQLSVRVEFDENYDVAAGFVRSRFLTAAELQSDDEGNYFVNLSNLRIGEHALRVRLTDGCGNVDVDVIEFCLVDGRAPTPICIMQTTISLAPDGNGGGEAAYWATDAIASPAEDCSGEVVYAIYKNEEARTPGFEPSIGDDAILFTCEDDATTLVRVYAFDPAGLSEYCTVLVLVQRAENACNQGDFGNISGAVTTSRGSPIAGVNLELTGPDAMSTLQTNSDGLYESGELVSGSDYTIDPDFGSYLTHSQGVSTFDLVLMTRYILGTDVFEAPYQHLAADANNSGDISVQDIIAVSRLILGLDLEYPNQEAWVFVEADFIFPVNNNPWATAFPEVINLNNLDGEVRDADFIGIMVGDVSGNRPGFTDDNNIRPRASAPALEVADFDLEAGQTYRVDIAAGDATGLAGLQGTFSVDDRAKLLSVTSGQFAPAHLNANLLSTGELPFSYADNRSLNATTPVVTLELRATADARLSEVLQLNDNRLRAEGYTAESQLTGLTIRFTGAATVTSTVALLQNQPNPVGEETVIGFQLSTASQASLTIRDISGRLVFEQMIDATAGINQLRINRNVLGAAGVLTYTLTAGDFTATRKMVVR
jgi:hypothetical protein